MQDPDPKCRHLGILWHFGIFANKSNKKSSPIFPIFPVFKTFPDFRLSDSTTLVDTRILEPDFDRIKDETSAR